MDNLKKLCKNKSVVFYCCGIFFEALRESFNLCEYFSVLGCSDLKFKNSTPKNLIASSNPLNNQIKPDDLKNLNVDFIIVTSPAFFDKEKFLKTIINKNTKILSIMPNNKKDFEEIKNNYKNVIKKIKSKEKIKVLFLCSENQKWSYTRLYKLLSTNERFEVLPVGLYPILSKGKIKFTQEASKKFFDRLNIKTIDIYDYKNDVLNIENLSFDIVFYEQPWYLFGAINPINVSKYALTILNSYGYTTVNSKNWGSEFIYDIYSSLWLFLSESPYHNKFYSKKCQMDENIFAFGSLKLEQYNYIQKTKLKKPLIIYGAHHSLGNGLKMSTFKRDYKFFLEFVNKNKQFDFIFKPHPMLKDSCIQDGFLDEAEYDNYINSWNKSDNAKVYNEGNYIDLFKNSSLLITDCSSFLAEYYPSKNPIILLDREDRAPFDDFGNIIKQGFYIANSKDEVEKLVNMLLVDKKDPKKKLREEILEKYFYNINEDVSKLVVNYILSKIN